MARSPKRDQQQSGSSTSPFRTSVILEQETLLFVLVSALDLFMTYLLLRFGLAVESNPVAEFFLFGWGVKGLVFFKFAMVAFIVTLTQIIGRKRPTAARWIVQLATLLVAGVVLYSFALMARQIHLI